MATRITATLTSIVSVVGMVSLAIPLAREGGRV